MRRENDFLLFLGSYEVRVQMIFLHSHTELSPAHQTTHTPNLYTNPNTATYTHQTKHSNLYRNNKTPAIKMNTENMSLTDVLRGCLNDPKEFVQSVQRYMNNPESNPEELGQAFQELHLPKARGYRCSGGAALRIPFGKQGSTIMYSGNAVFEYPNSLIVRGLIPSIVVDILHPDTQKYSFELPHDLHSRLNEKEMCEVEHGVAMQLFMLKDMNCIWPNGMHNPDMFARELLSETDLTSIELSKLIRGVDCWKEKTMRTILPFNTVTGFVDGSYAAPFINESRGKIPFEATHRTVKGQNGKVNYVPISKTHSTLEWKHCIVETYGPNYSEAGTTTQRTHAETTLLNIQHLFGRHRHIGERVYARYDGNIYSGKICKWPKRDALIAGDFTISKYDNHHDDPDVTKRCYFVRFDDGDELIVFENEFVTSENQLIPSNEAPLLYGKNKEKIFITLVFTTLWQTKNWWWAHDAWSRNMLLERILKYAISGMIKNIPLYCMAWIEELFTMRRGVYYVESRDLIHNKSDIPMGMYNQCLKMETTTDVPIVQMTNPMKKMFSQFQSALYAKRGYPLEQSDSEETSSENENGFTSPETKVVHVKGSLKTPSEKAGIAGACISSSGVAFSSASSGIGSSQIESVFTALVNDIKDEKLRLEKAKEICANLSTIVGMNERKKYVALLKKEGYFRNLTELGLLHLMKTKYRKKGVSGEHKCPHCPNDPGYRESSGLYYHLRRHHGEEYKYFVKKKKRKMDSTSSQQKKRRKRVPFSMKEMKELLSIGVVSKEKLRNFLPKFVNDRRKHIFGDRPFESIRRKYISLVESGRIQNPWNQACTSRDVKTDDDYSDSDCYDSDSDMEESIPPTHPPYTRSDSMEANYGSPTGYKDPERLSVMPPVDASCQTIENCPTLKFVDKVLQVKGAYSLVLAHVIVPTRSIENTDAFELYTYEQKKEQLERQQHMRRQTLMQHISR